MTLVPRSLSLWLQGRYEFRVHDSAATLDIGVPRTIRSRLIRQQLRQRTPRVLPAAARAPSVLDPTLLASAHLLHAVPLVLVSPLSAVLTRGRSASPLLFAPETCLALWHALWAN